MTRRASRRRLESDFLFSAAVFLFLIPALLHAPPPASAETGDALLLLQTGSIESLWSFVDAWESEGASFPHIYPPDLLIGDVPRSIESSLLADPRVTALHRKGDPVPAGKGNLRGPIIESWFNERDMEALPPIDAAGPRRSGLLVPAAAERTAPAKRIDTPPVTYGQAFGADFFQTSEWMLGKVAVGLVLPEFPGHRYSESEVASIHESVRGALDFWSSRVHGLPGVRFVYDGPHQVETTMNFMSHAPRIEEDRWVREVMGELGYHWSPHRRAEEPVYEYVDSLRTRYRTEWGICMFIPKVPSFPSAYISYAHFGGPFLVTPAGIRKDSGWLVAGESWLSHLLIHDTGHLFWALDESCESGYCVPCHIRSGYLKIFNMNSMNRDHVCDPIHVECAMEIPKARLCQYTLGHTGVWDKDEDGIPDVLDTHPYVYADTLPDTVNTVYPVIEGVAAVRPMLNYAAYSGMGAHASFGRAERRNDVTFNSIEHVIYRIDEMTDDEGLEMWLYADPEGGWGEPTPRIPFSFSPDSLTGGPHTIVLRAVNSVGNRSNWGERRIDLFVKAIALHDFQAVPDYDGHVRISFRVRGGTFESVADLYRRSDDGAEERIRTFPLRDDSAEEWVDKDPLPGKDHVYRLEVTGLGEKWVYETAICSPAPIKRGEHLSRITPNPFRANTVISYRVPQGNRADRTGGSGKPGEGPDIYIPISGDNAPGFAGARSASYKEARVEIDIYNVAGRRVRTFPPVHAFEGIYIDPILWDGTDDSGRRLTPGVYFIRLKTGDIRESRKTILLP